MAAASRAEYLAPRHLTVALIGVATFIWATFAVVLRNETSQPPQPESPDVEWVAPDRPPGGSPIAPFGVQDAFGARP